MGRKTLSEHFPCYYLSKHVKVIQKSLIGNRKIKSGGRLVGEKKFSPGKEPREGNKQKSAD